MKSVLLLIAAAFATTASPQNADDTLIGDWRGYSICVVRPSACHDEKALYHVKQASGQPDRFSLQANKIVNGQAVDMGTMECSYAREQYALTCSTPKLILHLKLKGKSLDGTMNLPDGTLWRNISLEKDAAR
ncbi:MAG TPA: hypothetical protein VN872_00530 [Candidatus Acidoferrum sp.]|nr:hypothetical protein [Candidatus Acidoferrum sp.]